MSPIFSPEKWLKDFSITCCICFADTISVNSLTSNLDQKCAFEQFESGPKLHFETWSCKYNFKVFLRSRSSVKLQFCSTFKLYECAILLQFRRWTLDQNCICKANPKRDTELVQKLFWTEIWPLHTRIPYTLDFMFIPFQSYSNSSDVRFLTFLLTLFTNGISNILQNILLFWSLYQSNVLLDLY